MLHTLLSEQRIRKITWITDWKEGIAIAAQPLVKDGSITEQYISEMIAAVERFGPYIVLTDKFALPHAQGTDYVKRTAMSLLIAENETDMKGQPVSMFMILASTDGKSHMGALINLATILGEKENLSIFEKGDTKKILSLIQELKR